MLQKGMSRQALKEVIRDIIEVKISNYTRYKADELKATEEAFKDILTENRLNSMMNMIEEDNIRTAKFNIFLLVDYRCQHLGLKYNIERAKEELKTDKPLEIVGDDIC